MLSWIISAAEIDYARNGECFFSLLIQKIIIVIIIKLF